MTDAIGGITIDGVTETRAVFGRQIAEVMIAIAVVIGIATVETAPIASDAHIPITATVETVATIEAACLLRLLVHL